MAAYEVLLLNTAVPQIQAAQAGDTYVVPRDIQITANLDVTGNTILGDASTDTVRVNGYMGVGGAGSTAAGLRVNSTSLIGVNQFGFLSDITATSAATNNITGYYTRINTVAATYTTVDVFNIQIRDVVKGAGHTITNQHGVYIADQTQGTNDYGITSLVSSGTDKWNIYASGTAANYFAGDLRVGTTTAFASEKLSVLGSTFNDLAAGNGSQNTSYDWLVGVSGNVGYPAKIVIDQGSSSTIHGMSFYTSSAASPTEKMRITAAGNVGIGTSSPTVKFEVNAGLDNIVAKFVSTDAGSWVQFNDNDALGYYLGAVTSGFVIRDTNNAERLRIDSSGNLISTAPTTPPTLSTNGTMVFNLTSDTNLRISVRGSDGVTRTANITLA